MKSSASATMIASAVTSSRRSQRTSSSSAKAIENGTTKNRRSGAPGRSRPSRASGGRRRRRSSRGSRAAGPRGLPRIGPAPPGHPSRRRATTAREGGGHDPARYHQVDGDEQVGLVTAGVQRYAEGKRGDDRQRKQARPAAEEDGQGSDRHGPQQGQRQQPRRAVAEIGDRRRVPLVAGDQDREEGQGRQHRDRARPRRDEQDRGRRGGGGRDHAGAGECAQPPCPRPARRQPFGLGSARWSRSVPPGVSVRSWPIRTTRNL